MRSSMPHARTATVVAVGAVLLLTAAATAADAGTRAVRTVPMHPALSVSYCSQNGWIGASFQVDAYSSATHAWSGAAGVPVTVQARLKGLTGEQDWFTDELAPTGAGTSGTPASNLPTGSGGSGQAKLSIHSSTMEYRLRLNDGTLSAVAQLQRSC